MYAYNKKRQRSGMAFKEVNSLGLQFSLKANASSVNERPGGKAPQPPHQQEDFQLTIQKIPTMPTAPYAFAMQSKGFSQDDTIVTDPDNVFDNSEFRLGRDPGQSYRSAFQQDYPASQHALHSSRRSSQPVSAESQQDHSLSASYGGHSDSRTPRHRQVHHPATAFATQLTDLDPTNYHQPAPPRGDDMPSVYTQSHSHSHPSHSHGATRQIQSAGSVQSRQVKPTSYVPDESPDEHEPSSDLGSPTQPTCAFRTFNSGDRVLFTESPSLPGVPVVYRTQEEKSLNPDRLNLDRRKLTQCPLLEGEDHLRLLNFQHNTIRRIEHLASLRRLIFLDLYDNRIEAISGLDTMRSLRVLMLGKNRIQKIDNLTNLVKLDVLDLHGNRISKVENIDHLQELRVLNLAGNEITHVDSLCGMDSLTELNLRRNKISTVTDVDTLPSLQRLFLSFNLIMNWDDISCLADSTSLIEVSLDGNPFCQEASYKSIILRNMGYLKQLDMKKISEEERKVALTVVKKEEQKKREVNRVAVLKEKRRLAIKNAARQWETSMSTSLAKTSRLQPAPLYGGGEMGGGSGLATPNDSRPGSSEGGSDRGHSVDLLDGRRSQDSSRPSTRSDSRQRKLPTPDLLANITTDEVCHLAELDGDTLHLYGSGSLDALDKNWGVQAAGSISTVSIKFVDFNKVARHLQKIRLRFPNVSNVNFGECNISNLVQLNALASLRRLDTLTISKQGNPITSFVLWKQYLLFRLAHLNIKKINGQPTDQHGAEKYFGLLAKLTSEELSHSRLQILLGDSRRRITQPLNELELKARRQLTSEQPSSSENAGKAGLVFLSSEGLASLQQERLSKSDLASTYIQQLTSEAVEANRKVTRLAQIWPKIFIGMVHKALLDMADLETYQQRALERFKNS
ncbi:leucine-rich repeat-containing protein 49 isoform X3 [Strongylocentrotus purpuratus]|uniref:Leucine-rich repeat-containing protein 49 n=1 Tax=Strongylocentrotus purpuratus TaxID=7668 RepID=A0A7M7N7Y7_STRPU|nr:leucine-rich repeat-containing protein 49 isoform X3 [Strongylocentrotus purpuratus]